MTDTLSPMNRAATMNEDYGIRDKDYVVCHLPIHERFEKPNITI